jgi:hypothetical protein
VNQEFGDGVVSKFLVLEFGCVSNERKIGRSVGRWRNEGEGVEVRGRRGRTKDNEEAREKGGDIAVAYVLRFLFFFSANVGKMIEFGEKGNKYEERRCGGSV